MSNVSISPIIGKLPAKERAAWIAARKKKRPDIDWEGEVKKLKDEHTPVSEESKKD